MAIKINLEFSVHLKLNFEEKKCFQPSLRMSHVEEPGRVVAKLWHHAWRIHSSSAVLEISNWKDLRNS